MPEIPLLVQIRYNFSGEFDIIAHNLLVNGDTIDGSDSSAEISIDYRTQFEVSQSDVVQAVTNLLDLDVPFKGDPASAKPSSFWLRISNGRSEISNERVKFVNKGIKDFDQELIWQYKTIK